MADTTTSCDATTLTAAAMAGLGASEWLLTNGLGGFAMGTASGIPQRRYHAWLVAASSPPVGRVVTLHGAAEWIVWNQAGAERRLCLSTFEFQGHVRSPDGLSSLERFVRDDERCVWAYRHAASGMTVTRQLSLTPYANACRVQYRVERAPAGARFELRPFMPLRDFHELDRRDAADAGSLEGVEGATIRVRRGHLVAQARLVGGGREASFAVDPQWWNRFEYDRDLDRGQEGLEDLHSPGVWRVDVPAGESTLELVVELVSPRLEGLQPLKGPDAPPPHLPVKLLGAASQFVVRRLAARAPGQGVAAATSRTSIIAGYPWFSDWGRDTCISLPGLLVVTGRLAEARECLEAFAELVEGGLVPNCFDDGSGRAEYNTADASLWYLNAACELAVALRLPLDPSGELSRIAGACLDIIHAYEHGTAFDISMDPADGLIRAGNAGTQLTWMDAKRHGVVFTPRHGKPVELSSLWYNGLRRVGSLLPATMHRRIRELDDIASWVDRSFEKAFWNAQAQSLFDCLTPRQASDGSVVGWDPSTHIRPNQIFAISLPHSPLGKHLHAGVLECVRRHLLTPVGLRTLAPGDAAYRPRYKGDLFSRDGAYHNGTVWPWLIGPYAEATLRVGGFSDSARARAREAVGPLLDQICREPRTPGPIRQICEVYDAEEPRDAEGCPAQAWSVAELLRVLHLIESPTPGAGA
ncbi:MAG: amylo-alpha-1,6-glucosidase [Phycisphaerae bacterium]|jgi:predicted glycogen debranching enzyme